MPKLSNLVKKKSAACVNIISSVLSVYRWKNEICEDEECLLIIKTKTELFERLKEDVLEKHSYEVPEIISVSIENGSPEYLNWIAESTAID